MFKLIIGFLVAFLIGAACRYFGLPVPAPPTILGVALIMAITLGFIMTDKLLSGRETGAPTETGQKVD